VISIQRDVFLTGAGLVRAIPGPAFSISSFIGGLSLSRLGTSDFILGCCIGAIGIFLPSFLLSVSLFPLWLTLQQYGFLQRILTGIKAGIVGVMVASTFFLTKDMYATIFNQSIDHILVSFTILLFTFLSLFSERVSPPLIVLLCGLIGIFF
jgi:chromate transporter